MRLEHDLDGTELPLAGACMLVDGVLCLYSHAYSYGGLMFVVTSRTKRWGMGILRERVTWIGEEDQASALALFELRCERLV